MDHAGLPDLQSGRRRASLDGARGPVQGQAPLSGETVSFRLIRGDDVPATNPRNVAFDFGLQDRAQTIHPGLRRADGAHVFDFTLVAKPGRDPDRPSFTGAFASGPADDRFVYLSWRGVGEDGYINRVKVRLAAVDWALVRRSQAEGRPITADMSGRGPGENTRPVAWTLG